jgi:hypothetical protein
VEDGGAAKPVAALQQAILANRPFMAMSRFILKAILRGDKDARITTSRPA